MNKQNPSRGGVKLSLSDSRTLKGIAIIMIIVSHTMSHLCKGYDIDYNFAHNWGSLGNSIFLFLSGFGIYMSMQKQADDLNLDYLWRHVTKIIYAFIYAFFATLFFVICSNDEYGLIDACKDFLTMTIPYTREWFLKAIIMLYIFSFIAFKISRKNFLRIILVLMLSLVYAIIGWKVGIGSWMYNTIFDFGLGMSFALAIQSFPIKTSVVYIPVLGVLYSATRIISLPAGFECTVYGLFFVLFLIAILQYVTYRSVVFDYIGRYSITFYLCHIGFIHFTNSLYIDMFVPIIAAFGLTVVYNKLTILIKSVNNVFS